MPPLMTTPARKRKSPDEKKGVAIPSGQVRPPRGSLDLTASTESSSEESESSASAEAAQPQSQSWRTFAAGSTPRAKKKPRTPAASSESLQNMFGGEKGRGGGSMSRSSAAAASAHRRPAGGGAASGEAATRATSPFSSPNHQRVPENINNSNIIQMSELPPRARRNAREAFNLPREVPALEMMAHVATSDVVGANRQSQLIMPRKGAKQQVVVPRRKNDNDNGPPPASSVSNADDSARRAMLRAAEEEKLRRCPKKGIIPPPARGSSRLRPGATGAAGRPSSASSDRPASMPNAPPARVAQAAKPLAAPPPLQATGSGNRLPSHAVDPATVARLHQPSSDKREWKRQRAMMPEEALRQLGQQQQKKHQQQHNRQQPQQQQKQQPHHAQQRFAAASETQPSRPEPVRKRDGIAMPIQEKLHPDNKRSRRRDGGVPAALGVGNSTVTPPTNQQQNVATAPAAQPVGAESARPSSVGATTSRLAGRAARHQRGQQQPSTDSSPTEKAAPAASMVLRGTQTNQRAAQSEQETMNDPSVGVTAARTLEQPQAKSPSQPEEGAVNATPEQKEEKEAAVAAAAPEPKNTRQRRRGETRSKSKPSPMQPARRAHRVKATTTVATNVPSTVPMNDGASFTKFEPPEQQQRHLTTTRTATNSSVATHPSARSPESTPDISQGESDATTIGSGRDIGERSPTTVAERGHTSAVTEQQQDFASTVDSPAAMGISDDDGELPATDQGRSHRSSHEQSSVSATDTATSTAPSASQGPGQYSENLAVGAATAPTSPTRLRVRIPSGGSRSMTSPSANSTRRRTTRQSAKMGLAKNNEAAPPAVDQSPARGEEQRIPAPVATSVPADQGERIRPAQNTSRVHLRMPSPEKVDATSPETNCTPSTSTAQCSVSTDSASATNPTLPTDDLPPVRERLARRATERSISATTAGTSNEHEHQRHSPRQQPSAQQSTMNPQVVDEAEMKDSPRHDYGASSSSSSAAVVTATEPRANKPRRRSSTGRSSRRLSPTQSEPQELLEPYDGAWNEPEIPYDLAGKWTYDPASRVLLGNFEGMDEIPRTDAEFILSMMECDHISLVTEGMMRTNQSSQASMPHNIPLDAIERAFGKKPYHKFRRFDRKTSANGTVSFEESNFVSMRVTDFMKYLRMREVGSHQSFKFVDTEKKTHRVDNVNDVVFYMIDCDIPKYLPGLLSRYTQQFKMKNEILPGGSFCMMNAIPASARPFMGPNMYLSPPGGFTSLHQDGHGGVDSGHTCIAGHNEVVMLRRLPDEHKFNATNYLPEDNDAVYDLPHNNSKDDLKTWPKLDTIEEWERMNYCPSVFILKPGQHLHINKGRLHCFRKLSPDPLPEDDCHHFLREEMIKEIGTDPAAYLCYSVAFDWMFLGWSAEGIKEEFMHALDCADLCREHNKKCLGVPATTLLQLASAIGPLEEAPWIQPEPLTVCRGIMEPLQMVVDREIPVSDEEEIRAEVPDSHQDPASYPIDPYGDSDYNCKICDAELSNTYFHCVGCEKLLSRDLNICVACHNEGKFQKRIKMHHTQTKWATDIHHMGELERNNKGKGCACHQGTCSECKLCRRCSCRCHQTFQQNRRFFNSSELKGIVKRCKNFVEQSMVGGQAARSSQVTTRTSTSLRRSMVGALVQDLEER